MLVLALDVGSTSAKAQVYDSLGRAVGPLVRRPTPFGDDGTADPEAVGSAADAVVDEAVTRLNERPDAVAVACAWHALVGLDKNGVPTTRISTWYDTRAGAAAAELRRRVCDAEALRQRTGAPLHPSFPPARVLWLSRHDPAAFAATARWCSLGELLERRWFGPGVGPSPSMASATGFYDQKSGHWDTELPEVVGIAPASLAAVDPEPRRGLTAEYRGRWRPLRGLPWLPALGDGACAVVGSGCAVPRRAALTVGTSAAVRILSASTASPDRPLTTALFRYLLDHRRPVVGGARSNAGNLVDWARWVLRIDAADPVAAVTDGRRPGGHGLEAQASLAGERSPDWPIEARGRVAGMRTDTGPLDILQAFVEDAAMGIAATVDALEEWAGPFDVVLSGGASAAAGWRRLLSDAMARPVVRTAVDEASARGAALVAAEALGGLDPSAVLPVDAEVTRPDPERAEAFAHLRPLRRAVRR